MKRIFAWQTDTGMCHNYRTVFPFQALPRDQWEFSWGAPRADIKDHDVVVGQRLIGHNELWRELAHSYSGLMVYDLDDDLIDVDPENTVPYNLCQPQRLGTIANIEMADVVTVSTPRLAEKVRRWNPDVVVLENRLPQSWLNRNESPVAGRIGWAGSPFHGQDFDPRLLAQLRQVKNATSWRTIGGRHVPWAEHIGYQPLETATRHFDFWVGIAPLKICEFNQSKSWCKALEYAFHGIPVVASAVGQYPEWINRFGGGILVPPGGSFTEAIDEAIELRPKLADEAWQAALANTIEGHGEAWNAVYNGVW